MTTSTLDEAVRAIRERHVDCSPCPPERHCCIFGENWNVTFSRSQAYGVAGYDAIAGLVASGIIAEVPEGYQVITGPCPALTDSYTCRIHADKHALKLEQCIEFPLFTTNYDPLVDDERIVVVADYRCYSIEQQWERLEPELHNLVSLHHPVVLVRCISDKGREYVRLDSFGERRALFPLQHLR